jgi:hypothetical protein
MIRSQYHAAIVVLPVAASTRAAEAAPVEEPGLFSPTTLGAVVGAILVALLIVAVVRRVDR